LFLAVCSVVITSLSGAFIDHIGGNGALLKDGSFEEAAFSRPQGLAHSPHCDTLFVADTENHALRKVSHLHGSGKWTSSVQIGVESGLMKFLWG